MLTRVQKEEQVAVFSEKFGRAVCVYVADYRGVGVDSVNLLRREIRKGGDHEYRVAKNSVLRRAAEGSDIEGIIPHFSGPTAVAISYDDPAGLAKIVSGFAKENEDFEIKAGVLDGNVIGTEEIATLATLPSLDVLRGQIIGLVMAPATKIARLLMEPGAQLARLAGARGSQEDTSE
ncbi:MAG: 50S ribosomal protein L10 [Actinomycetota bacterium]|nr:50S ribosomal protein L10 [Actinomycetota bacterium]